MQELEERLDEKTAQLIHLQRVTVEHNENSPYKSRALENAALGGDHWLDRMNNDNMDSFYNVNRESAHAHMVDEVLDTNRVREGKTNNVEGQLTLRRRLNETLARNNELEKILEVCYHLKKYNVCTIMVVFDGECITYLTYTSDLLCDAFVMPPYSTLSDLQKSAGTSNSISQNRIAFLADLCAFIFISYFINIIISLITCVSDVRNCQYHNSFNTCTG